MQAVEGDPNLETYCTLNSFFSTKTFLITLIKNLESQEKVR